MQSLRSNQNPAKHLYDLVFLNETWYIQNPDIFRIMAYFETVVYSELCQIYTMKYFIQNPSGQHFQTPDAFRTLTYSELGTLKILRIFKINFLQNHVQPWYIHDPCIFKLQHIESPSNTQNLSSVYDGLFFAELCVTMVYSELEAYLEPYLISMMEDFIQNLV